MGPSMISSENGLLRGSVLMNVRGRDVGSFVDEAQRAVARDVKLPSGYYIEWSGQYENQISATPSPDAGHPSRVPDHVSLLYKIYDSLKEALHVMLAVPFALTRRNISPEASWATTSPLRFGSASSHCSAPPCRPAW